MPRRRRKPRKNPTRRQRVYARVRSGIGGVNYRTALKNVPINVVGMFIAKWFAKRGSPAALEADPSTWNGMTYLKGAGGTALGAYIANMIRPGWGQKILEGGLGLLMYKAVQNHLIPKSSTAMGQLGAYQPGDVEVNSAGEPFILGADGQSWIPMNEGDTGVPEMAGIGQDEDWTMMDALETPGRLGDYAEPPGRLGFGVPATAAAYSRALFER
jgi:hypothetical protein